MQYTVETVKELLPDVKVKVSGRQWKGKVFDGRVSGRKNKFATVTITIDGVDISFECTWETIALVASNNSTILF